MTRPIYSAKFFDALNTVGPYTGFTLLAGDIGILKHMSLWVRDDHPVSVLGSAVTVALDDPNIFVWDLKGPPLMSGVYQWAGWEVFEDSIYINAQSFAYSLRASGTVLTPT